jgi:DNA polymerase I-like protein with 3'-5' exonuclease and polymerase domains
LGHAERASINTPIQGGAADIAMMAMKNKQVVLAVNVKIFVV